MYSYFKAAYAAGSYFIMAYPVETSTDLSVLVPHPVTVQESIRCGTEMQTFAGVAYTEAARSAITHKPLATFDLKSGQDTRHKVPLRVTRHGSLHGLPDYPQSGQPEKYYIVSRPAVAAALAQERPVDDLLVPYDNIYNTDGRVVAVRGLARIMPVLREHDVPVDISVTYKDLQTRTRLVNRCPFPAMLFAPELADTVSAAPQPLVSISPAPSDCRLKVMYCETLAEELTSRFKVPVFDVCFSYVAGWPVERNCQENQTDDESQLLTIVPMDVAVALGSTGLAAGCVTLTGDVRKATDAICTQGSVIGGTALTVFDDSVFGKYIL